MKKSILIVFTIALLFTVATISLVHAWTNPVLNPPGGGGAIRIGTGGNVGIGTATPGVNLDLVRNTGDVVIRLGSGIANDTAMFGWSAGGGFAYAQGGTWGGTTRNFILQGGGGNVGIGTTTPGTRLDIAGTARMTGLQLGTTATAGHVLTANASGVGTWQAPAGGATINAGNVSAGNFGANTGLGNFSFPANVGIGTTAPAHSLSIAGGYQTTGLAGSASHLHISATGASPNAAQIVWGDNTGWRLHFGTRVAGTFTERMTILDTGNVGIGTTAPTNRLTVAGGITVTSATGVYEAGVLGFTDSNWGFLHRPPRAGGVAAHQFQSFGGVNLASITEAGNVGIGTTAPTARLEVVGNIIAAPPTAANHVATRGWVESHVSAGTVSSIVTERCASGAGACPAWFCPAGWTMQANWSSTISVCQTLVCCNQTLCQR